MRYIRRLLREIHPICRPLSLLSMKLPVSFSALVLLLSASLMSCEEPVKTDLTASPLIPLPREVTASGGSFEMNAQTGIALAPGAEDFEGVAQSLAEMLRPATGWAWAIQTGETPDNSIRFQLSADLPEEGYQLLIEEKGVTIYASQPAGAFFATQTLRQLLPDAVEAATASPGPWTLPTGNIQDAPTYAYRGSMLDVARHFFNVEETKRFIDFLAAYKFNVLHLHLTDDQGWRIEIKSWPRLTEHGSSTEVGGGPGGFFTQEQYKDIVAYAAARFITVIPEIDMPGHTNSALASYPELNCDGKAPELHTGIEVGFSSFCTDKEITYAFIDSVVRELAAITPGPYIHIGGDESHSTALEDYLPFINRAKGIVEAHGKTMIGWDETAQADLGPGAVVQLWNNADFAAMAVKKGAKLIMSPAKKAYMDMQYDSTSRIGLHWAAYIEVPDGYDWDPSTIVPGIGRDAVIGMECPLWSETTTNIDDIEYLTFPRLPGYAEVGWTPMALRNWEAYEKRLASHASRMTAMGIDFYRSPKVAW